MEATGLSLRENMENRLYEEKQMTASSLSMTGAPSSSDRDWNQIDWQQARSQVRQLQMRIAKAVREEKWVLYRALFQQAFLRLKRTASQLVCRFDTDIGLK